MSRITSHNLLATLAAAAALTTAALTTAAPAASAQFGSAGGAQAGLTTQTTGVQNTAQTATTPVRHAAAVPTGAHAGILQGILDATNAYRATQGVAPVRYNAALERVAQNWSDSQAAAGAISHNPNLRTLYPAGWTAFGENVQQNWDDATAAQLVQAWINSPSHRSAMINPAYTGLGLGYTVTADHKIYATQNYARF